MKIKLVNKSKNYKKFREDLWGLLCLNRKKTRSSFFLYNCFINSPNYKKILLKNNIFSRKKSFLYYLIPSEIEFNLKTYSFRSLNKIKFKELSQFYGNIKRKKIFQFFSKLRKKNSKTALSFLYFLESRVEVVLFRTNIFNSIIAARQFISHGNVLLNNKPIKNPGYNLKLYDVITIKKEHHSLIYKNLKYRLLRNEILQNYPSYLEVNYKIMSFIFIKEPTFEEVRYPFDLDVEYMFYNFLKSN